jgi:hypothetical protein
VPTVETPAVNRDVQAFMKASIVALPLSWSPPYSDVELSCLRD